MNSRVIVFAGILAVSSLVLGGCTSASSPATTPAAPAGQAQPLQADQKVGDTRMTGVISESQGKFFLAEPGKTPKEIESYQVELSSYVGQSVTVVGQYSGDTLFVGKVE